jgi:hypothetical protein
LDIHVVLVIISYIVCCLTELLGWRLFFGSADNFFSPTGNFEPDPPL